MPIGPCQCSSFDTNVGIGTTTPGTLLHINSTASSSLALMTLESDINEVNEYNEVVFKMVSGLSFASIRQVIHAPLYGALAFTLTEPSRFLS